MSRFVPEPLHHTVFGDLGHGLTRRIPALVRKGVFAAIALAILQGAVASCSEVENWASPPTVPPSLEPHVARGVAATRTDQVTIEGTAFEEFLWVEVVSDGGTAYVILCSSAVIGAPGFVRVTAAEKPLIPTAVRWRTTPGESCAHFQGNVSAGITRISALGRSVRPGKPMRLDGETSLYVRH